MRRQAMRPQGMRRWVRVAVGVAGDEASALIAEYQTVEGTRISLPNESLHASPEETLLPVLRQA